MPSHGTSGFHKPTLTRALLRGFTKRCPRCGSGRLFKRWFTMVDRCPRCDLLFNREEGFFLGAFVINFVVTEIALLIYIPVAFVLTLPDPPVGKLILVGIPVVLLVPALFYPLSKTLWAAIDLFMRDPDRAAKRTRHT